MRLPALALILGLSPVAATACGVELVLAMDVSRSVVNAEYDLQMGGLAAAFRHPEVVEAIGWVPGGVMASVTEWSGARSQAQTVGWRELKSPESVAAFATEIETTRRQFFGRFTAVGEALFHANKISATNPRVCQRRVIDISGDGKSNRGREPGPISVALAANGVTINALVIKGAKPDPEEYYLQNVINGPGAFVEVVDRFEDYETAMTRKLLRELSPSMAAK
ncbi:MAG: DUF1194 domain-containing protein [Pseudomonadota bacterium]